MDKKTARTYYSDKRNKLADKSAKSSQITERLISHRTIISADLVLTYVSIGSEVSTDLFIERMLRKGKKIAVPKCDSNGIMHFHIIKSTDDLRCGKYNIPEPAEYCPVAEITDKTLCIVPGLAFTCDGKRLGYGGGYYDRFLSVNPNIYTIALTYDELVADELPCEPHDISINAILTEKRMVFCSAE